MGKVYHDTGVRNIGDWLPEWVRRGGPGSGHFEHAGRPGVRGGSLPGDAAAQGEMVATPKAKREWAERLRLGEKRGPRISIQRASEARGWWLSPEAEFYEVSMTHDDTADDLLGGARNASAAISELGIRPSAGSDREYSGDVLLQAFGWIRGGQRPRAGGALMFVDAYRYPTTAQEDAVKALYMIIKPFDFEVQDSSGTGKGSRGVRGEAERIFGEMPDLTVERGGPGSGHHGHEGRPGERGGSLPGDATAEGDRRRAPGKAVRSERIQSLMQSVASAGGMVALDMDDWPTVAKAWEINARRLDSSVDFPGHKEKMLKGIREEIEMKLRVGGPMPERYAVPYLEAYQQLLAGGEFGDRIPLLILRDVITKDEAQAAKETHPRLNYWAEPDTGVQARYLLHLDAIEALSFQSLRSGHGEDAVFNDFQEWMRQSPSLVGNYGQSAPTLTSDMYDNKLAGILLHEYGHSQAWNAPSDLGETTRANALLAVSDVRVREYISYYAGENPAELLAEAYAVMRHPDYEAKAQPTTKAIVEYLWRKGPVPDWMTER